MKYCKCPKCKNRQELIPKHLMEMIQHGAVKMFNCDSCAYSTQIVAEKQRHDRVILFFAMSEVEDGDPNEG